MSIPWSIGLSFNTEERVEDAFEALERVNPTSINKFARARLYTQLSIRILKAATEFVCRVRHAYNVQDLPK